jgi:hypothetical protein
VALDKKLAANFRDLKTKPFRVEAGWDDAIEQLHPARFFPGPACLLTTYWEKGQQQVPEAGIRALAHYDFESLAIGPNVSTKGCYFLHDPGSPHLTIKYFLASNFNITEKSITHSRSAELSTLSVEDQLAEPSSFTELQQALVAATLAQHIITPWNYSISALLGFMSSSRFCQASYASGWTSERVTMLRRFINRVFSVNASHSHLHQFFASLSVLHSILHFHCCKNVVFCLFSVYLCCKLSLFHIRVFTLLKTLRRLLVVLK